MEPFEKILSLNEKEAVKYWFELCNNCYETQEEVLLNILENAKDTEISRRYNFKDIKSIKDYQETIPILEYEDISDYIEEMALAKENVLFAGKTLFFISTSGTTGTSKKIPENDLSQKAKSSVLKLRNSFLGSELFEKIKNDPKIIKYLTAKGVDLKNPNSNSVLDKFHFYSVTSASPNNKTEGGIDVGFASGKTFENSSFGKSLAYPKEIMGLTDGEATMYLSMLFSLIHDDIVIITSNNAGRVYARIKYAQKHAKEIITDLRNGTINEELALSEDERKLFEDYIEPHPQRADFLEELLNKGKDYFIPKYYWPNMIAARFWLTGSVGVNVDKVKPYLPDNILYFDIGYGASEGKLSIPKKSNSGAGTLSIASIFYEFISQENGEILTANQLELDKEYELILTNYAGLYRYPLHDIIRVTGFTGSAPDIEFVTKSKEILNIAQEKVPAPSVIDELRKFLEKNSLILTQAQILPDLTSSNYQIFIEVEENQKNPDLNRLSKEFDKLLRNKFELYNRNRNFDSIKALKLNLMKNGWQKQLYKNKEKNGIPQSQVKLESIINKKPEEKWIKEE